MNEYFIHNMVEDFSRQLSMIANGKVVDTDDMYTVSYNGLDSVSPYKIFI